MAARNLDKTRALINLKTDQLLSPSKAGHNWPGCAISYMSVHRYMRHGKAGVVLPSVMIGNRRYTTKRAIEWFVEEVRDYRIEGTGRKPQKARKVSQAAAKKRLDRAGVK